MDTSAEESLFFIIFLFIIAILLFSFPNFWLTSFKSIITHFIYFLVSFFSLILLVVLYSNIVESYRIKRVVIKNKLRQ